MSRLPEAYEEDTIYGMSVGEKGFTVPWAMWADADRVLWINGDYTIHKEAFGTAHLYIERTKEGVIVYQFSIRDHKFSIGGSASNFVGGVSHVLPVDLK
jgi:hypothetical protein